jgi:cell division inhibitor SulA
MAALLRSVINHPDIWRARQASPDTPADIDTHSAANHAKGTTDKPRTGNAHLDAILPNGTWPDQGLIELLITHDGIGETTLMLPLLAQCSQKHPVVLVAPPYQPCALHWQQKGVQLDNLHIIQCDDNHALWASEQALRAGCCSLVMCWPKQANDTALRRLQIAASQSGCIGLLVRDAKYSVQASPAPVRLRVQRSQQGSTLQLLKCRGIYPNSQSTVLQSTVLQ